MTLLTRGNDGTQVLGRRNWLSVSAAPTHRQDLTTRSVLTEVDYTGDITFLTQTLVNAKRHSI
jgi:hypothetical protein